ncbi:1-acyl-sn-glycerol-3-phosphate acyltransferase [Chitinophaga polysaccharea]|uniref:lysophospholipid acyltransferase family protein n=1 Tax=Chitinophaga TaxID=79328 RepID=UPI00145564AB|nr:MULTISPECIES: lysophospholipid acyltransferase family protein [Chitinophaga]NLR57036.1 1-acyl-sn-glycerol-3-phosphate acyltransferase [Chitinophaga polysaccharea]NLU91839.1 1-acyl-sn-glycerol-3-phosphate acyltransferase [Chitinophaga sp. Ak27]
MNFVLKPLRVIYVIYAAAVFLGIMFLILPPIFLASLLGRQKGGNIIFYFLRFWAHAWFPLVGMWVTRKYECERDNDPCIYVVNHRSYLDAAIAVKVMRLPFRPLGKVELSKVPFFGFIYRNSVVAVDRSNAAARARSVREMMTALRAGISILVFPEGTTNESEQPLRPFHNGAFRMAIELQMPIKPVLYLDAGDRLPHNFMRINPGKCRVVFLPPVPVAGLTMDDINTLKQKVHDIMDAELRKHRQYPTLQPIG